MVSPRLKICAGVLHESGGHRSRVAHDPRIRGCTLEEGSSLIVGPSLDGDHSQVQLNDRFVSKIADIGKEPERLFIERPRLFGVVSDIRRN